ncbi:hypothetical protein K7H13_03460 [Qipengyuania citrea]|uniref:hypothetical protein n=1 Tax=Qipengyuania citrea TaxID=225971 RepID=UPI001E2F08C8|nr:hypothetical protein [Qipengyuania citrea]MCD1589820.1 hypothetical protein [Qipengyuania citrea]
MLQIIGWLGCLYLVVKAFELFSASKHRAEEGSWDTAAMVGGAIALVGAFFFLMLINGQVDAAPY